MAVRCCCRSVRVVNLPCHRLSFPAEFYWHLNFWYPTIVVDVKLDATKNLVITTAVSSFTPESRSQTSTSLLHQFGTGTVRIHPPLPTKSTITQSWVGKTCAARTGSGGIKQPSQIGDPTLLLRCEPLLYLSALTPSGERLRSGGFPRLPLRISHRSSERGRDAVTSRAWPAKYYLLAPLLATTQPVEVFLQTN